MTCWVQPHLEAQVLSVEVLGDGDAEHAVNTLPGTVWVINSMTVDASGRSFQSPTSDGEEEAA